MSVDLWKTIFDWAAVVFVGFSLIAAGGALLTGRIINDQQSSQLGKFKSDLTAAQSDLAKQRERTANADAHVAGLEKDVVDAEADMAKQQTRAAIAEKSLLELQKNSIGGKYLRRKGTTFLLPLLANEREPSR